MSIRYSLIVLIICTFWSSKGFQRGSLLKSTQVIRLSIIHSKAQPQSKRQSVRGPKQSSPSQETSTTEDDSQVVDASFKLQMREFRKANAPKKLLKAVEELSQLNKLDQNMTIHAFRTLQRMNRSDLCPELFPLWQHAVDTSPAKKVELEPASSMLKSFCRLNRTDLAESIAATAGAFHNTTHEEFVLASRTLLPDLALGHLLSGTDAGHDRCLSLLFRLASHENMTVDLEFSKTFLKAMLKDARTISDARIAIRLLLQLGGLTDNDSLQLLTSSFMRSLDFVKGAVSMETLPPVPAGPPHCNEAAFIGRSNVGKSSLINMLANRKGLAFTSKTPGKTSEFNYFDANGTVGSGSPHGGRRSKGEQHRFYLVDLPGVGYAEVSRDLKASWLALLRQYATLRPNLRILFHLIDSRHGMLDADSDCLDLLPALPDYVQYCIVLTKADKRGGGMRPDVFQRIQREVLLRTHGSERVVPILLSSSETREGGVEIWSTLLDAVSRP